MSGKHSMATALAWPLTLSHEGGDRQDYFPLACHPTLAVGSKAHK